MGARLAIALILSLALWAAGPASAASEGSAREPRVGDADPRVTIAMLPTGTEVEDIAAFLPDAATGLLSAGLGRVPASQTYLDIGQGNRLFSSLYPEPLTPLYVTGDRIPFRLWWRVLERAREAPAEIVPGLLAGTLAEAGIRTAASPLSGLPALIAADESGRVSRNAGCERRPCPGLTIVSSALLDLDRLAAGLRLERGDVLIVIERPPPERDLLSFGILGAGFSGQGLRSESTRMDGYALSTDLFPTIAGIYGVEVPDEVGGRRIVPVPGGPDHLRVTALERRLESVSERRFPALGISLLGWIGLGLLSVTASRSFARPFLVLLATATALVPALLQLSAALRPSVLVEGLIVGLGAPLLALLLWAAASWALERAPRPASGRASGAGDRVIGGLSSPGGYGAYALAATLSLLCVGIDVVTGSTMTALSLLGPNPGLGVRFFGIGNELEALLGALLLLGSGAAVTALPVADPRRAVAVVTAGATLLAVVVFAPGRFGADVGAAITFPAGAAGTAIAALGLHRGRRRGLLAVLLAPLLALALLFAIDIAIPGDSHLARSVLGAGGLEELGDVFDRRITLAARSFPSYIDSPFFVAALLAIAAAICFRRRLVGWFEGRPAAAAATVGAIAATVIGTLANDSAALLLMVGTGYLAAFCGLVWACRGTGR